MRRSELTQLADAAFGPTLAATYRRETVLASLDNRTVDQALADGEDTRRAWFALCEEMGVPERMRWELPEPGQRRRVADT